MKSTATNVEQVEQTNNDTQATPDVQSDVQSAAMKPWKAAWLNANRAYKGLRSNLWKLTKILNEVFDDAEFRADNGLRDDLAAADWIDAKLSELPIGYMELRTIMEYYPDKESWEGTKLSKLRDSIKPAKSSKPAKPRAAKPVTAQIKRERDFYMAKARHLERQVSQAKRQPKTEQKAEQREAEPTRNAESVMESAEPADNEVIVYAERLIAIIDAGVDYNDAKAMEALERLHAALESILQPMTA